MNLEKKKLHIKIDELGIDKEYTKEDIKSINLKDIKFKEVTKDDEIGKYLYIINKGSFILPDFFIKTQLAGPLNTEYKINFFDMED